MNRQGFGFNARQPESSGESNHFTAVCDSCGMEFQVALYEPQQRVCDTCEAHGDAYAEEREDERLMSMEAFDRDLEDR